MIYWAQLLHFYQPPTQLPAVLEKVCDESYRPLIRVFQDHPHAKATVNINGVLTEMLRDYGHQDVIRGLRKLAEGGQIEFVGSGKYHPILPLIPREEAARQIAQNRRTNSYFFGKSYRPQGFFPPELCYSQEAGATIAQTGHRWVVLGGVACPIAWPVDVIHQVEANGKRLAVFFRDDILSNKISFQQVKGQDFLAHLECLAWQKERAYVVTAMDAETYGHHIQNWERLFLAEVYEELQPRKETHTGIKQVMPLAPQQMALLEAAEARQVRTVTISELLDLFPLGEVVEPRASSWSTTGGDLAVGNPYPLWWDPGNEIHRLQWEHTNICIELVKAAKAHADNGESRYFADIARGLLDRALHSCQFWWASRRPMWDINLIHRGLIEQEEVVVNAFKAINISPAPGEVKREYYYKVLAARDARSKIVDRLFLY